MITFCKSAECPSSLKLLQFQRGEITANNSLEIEAHLNVCEFCEAEIEFYSNYPQADENVPKVEIPVPLFELARSLMGYPNQDLLAILFDEGVPT